MKKGQRLEILIDAIGGEEVVKELVRLADIAIEPTEDRRGNDPH